ncbi:unnamed protein product [Merluccius merluccius]
MWLLSLLQGAAWLGDARAVLLCVLAVLVVLLVVDLYRNRHPPNFPPGPPGLPFLGNVSVGYDYHSMNKLAERFGSVFSVRWGGDRVVVVSGYRAVREVLVTQGDVFLERPISPLFHQVFKGNGISTSNGYKWRRQRQFSIAHLKNFGEGKKSLERHIQLESNFLCSAFQQETGAFNPKAVISSASANVIGSLVFGKRFDYDETDFQNLLQKVQESMLLLGTVRVQLYDSFPWLFKHLPGPHEVILSNYALLVSFLRREIEKHETDWDPSDHRDFIDAYIGQIDKKKEDVEAGFDIDNLATCTLDLFEAGSQTVASTLSWSLVYMVKYPEIQGQSRQPCIGDRAGMHYTEAVLHETQRMGDLLPLAIPRLASRDTSLAGYSIPQGSLIVVNLSSVLHDPNEWETPLQFNPQHFLDECGHFRKRDAFYPFSAGKRQCIAEQLVRMELFLFFSTVLQRFSVSSPPGQEVSLEPEGLGVLTPKPFLMCVRSR